MREIGSEFWDVPVTSYKNNLFPKSTQWFLSGRCALKAIIKDLKDCHTVAMPFWCCDSIVKPFIDAGMDVRFYHVSFRNEIKQEISLNSDVLFILDYFGYSLRDYDLNDYKGIVIRDVTHSIMSDNHSDANYYFGSLRKWCGFWTGGYAWTKDGHSLLLNETHDNGYTVLREKAMQLKNNYINNEVDVAGKTIADKGYLKIYDAAEECLENIGILSAAERDVKLAKKLDVEFIKSRRRRNAKILMDSFQEQIIFKELKDSDCPMFVPILVPDGKRDDLRRFLIKKDIYCPIHWPVSEYHRLNEKERFLYDNELSLVCDQRYTEEDMYRIVENIELFWRK